MIATRLKHLAESRGWFNSQQTGFRKGHGCEDQIIRIIQAVENGFQAYTMKRSVIALLDSSKAFDTVWRDTITPRHGRPRSPKNHNPLVTRFFPEPSG